MREIAQGPCQTNLVKLSLLHPHFLRCKPKVGVSLHMRFLINFNIDIEAQILYQLMNKCHGILCFWHKRFLFCCLLSCLQLETIQVCLPSSTTEVTKPLRLMLFLIYRMSRFLGFCFTKIYPNSSSSQDLFLRYPNIRFRYRYSKDKLRGSHNRR